VNIKIKLKLTISTHQNVSTIYISKYNNNREFPEIKKTSPRLKYQNNEEDNTIERKKKPSKNRNPTKP